MKIGGRSMGRWLGHQAATRAADSSMPTGPNAFEREPLAASGSSATMPRKRSREVAYVPAGDKLDKPGSRGGRGGLASRQGRGGMRPLGREKMAKRSMSAPARRYLP